MNPGLFYHQFFYQSKKKINILVGCVENEIGDFNTIYDIVKLHYLQVLHHLQVLVGVRMAKKMKKVKVICLLLLLVLIAIAVPVSAVTLVDLNNVPVPGCKFIEHNDHLTLAILRIHRSVFLLHIWWIGIDIQTIQMPTYHQTGTLSSTLPERLQYMSNTVSITGGTDTTIDYLSQPYKIYLQANRADISASQDRDTGNPFVLKYNPSSASGRPPFFPPQCCGHQIPL